MTKNKKKISKKAEETPVKAPVLSGTLIGIPVNFELDYQKSLLDWSYSKQGGRQLDLEMIAELDAIRYKELLGWFYGSDFVKESLLKDKESINAALKLIGLHSLNFDFIIVECTISTGDADQYSEFTRYSGIPLTVNGGKYIKELENSNEQETTAS